MFSVAVNFALHVMQNGDDFMPLDLLEHDKECLSIVSRKNEV